MTNHAPRLRLVRSDEEITQAPAVVDLDDFNAIYCQNAPYIAAFGLRLLGRQSDADELVQEVFLCAYEKLDQLRDPAALRPWLRKIAAREAYRMLRRRRTRWILLIDRMQYYDLPDESIASPQQRELLRLVFKKLDALPPKLSLPWRLRVLEGEKLEEVARLCDCSLATVKRRIQKAQQHIESERS